MESPPSGIKMSESGNKKPWLVVGGIGSGTTGPLSSAIPTNGTSRINARTTRSRIADNWPKGVLSFF